MESTSSRPQTFFPVSAHYAQRFGQRVQKIPVSIATDCPNRRGLKGMQTCIFCDPWGSAAYAEQAGVELTRQVALLQNRLGKRYASRKFLVYFQAYTGSFLSVQRLQREIETALSVPDVVGFVLGTRPDCLPPAVLRLLHAYSKRVFVSVELGVQSFDDKQLVFLRRGHTSGAAREALRQLKEHCPGVDRGIHLIFGLPGETDADMIEVARVVNAVNVHHVKLHNLHVLRNTDLEKLFAEGKFVPLEFEAYCRRVGIFLQHLNPSIAIQRLAAVASRWDELVAPEWNRHKMKCHQQMLDYFARAGIQQGSHYSRKVVIS